MSVTGECVGCLEVKPCWRMTLQYNDAQGLVWPVKRLLCRECREKLQRNGFANDPDFARRIAPNP